MKTSYILTASSAGDSICGRYTWLQPRPEKSDRNMSDAHGSASTAAATAESARNFPHAIANGETGRTCVSWRRFASRSDAMEPVAVARTDTTRSAKTPPSPYLTSISRAPSAVESVTRSRFAANIHPSDRARRMAAVQERTSAVTSSQKIRKSEVIAASHLREEELL